VRSGLVQGHSPDQPMLRRTFGRALVCLFVAAPRIAITQGAALVRRIGLLHGGPPTSDDELGAPLRELGWEEGRNLRIERRYSNGRLEALVPLAEELVRANVEVIVTNGPNPTLAAMRATTTIPIVFQVASDPVLSGLVTSLARPAGNVTGFSASLPEATTKMLSLLKEALPAFRRLGVLQVAGNPQYRLLRSWLEPTSRAAGIEPFYVEIATTHEIQGAIEQMARQHVEALLLFEDSFTIDHRSEIIAAALRFRLATVGSSFAEDGVLATYSVPTAEASRRFAYYVDRILRGAKPADLPVEQPTRFELVINLKTATTLGLTIPQTVLLQADEVIR